MEKPYGNKIIIIIIITKDNLLLISAVTWSSFDCSELCSCDSLKTIQRFLLKHLNIDL